MGSFTGGAAGPGKRAGEGARPYSVYRYPAVGAAALGGPF